MAIDYTKMDDKSLKAMLEVATDENAAKIKDILASRQVLQVKMSNEELAKIVADLKRENLGKRCKLVPNGSSDMVCGTIKGVIGNYNMQKPYYTIMDDNGIRHTIEANSPLLEISKDVDVQTTMLSDVEWDNEKVIEDNLNYVGLIAEWVDSKGESHRGRVVSIIPDKTHKRAFVRIKEYRKSLDSLKEKLVYTRKLINGGLEKCVFSEDGSTQMERKGYLTKIKLKGKKRRFSPAQKVELCRKEYDEALKVYNRAKDILEMRAKNLADAEKILKKETLRQLKMEEERQ